MINGGSINGVTLNGSPESGVYLFASDSVNLSVWHIADHGAHLLDSMILLGGANVTIAWALKDAIEVAASGIASGELTISVQDITRLSGAPKSTLSLLLSESITASASVSETINRLVNIAERLRVTGVVSSQLEANIVIAAAVAIAAYNDNGWHLLVADTVTASVDLSSVFESTLAIMAEATMSGDVAPNLVLVTTTDDSFSVLDDSASFIEFIESLGDAVSFGGSLALPDGRYYTAWVSNLHTGAPFTYTNYPFNSFAVAGTRQFGCTDNGIYELIGNDDDGTSIDAVIRSGLMDFGTAYVKNMELAYLGYSSSGELILKVIDTDGGEKRSMLYTLSETNNAVAENRLILGRGVKARYWQFEVTNVNGADFLLDTLDMLPVILNRRR
jgi:hypothetical protein